MAASAKIVFRYVILRACPSGFPDPQARERGSGDFLSLLSRTLSQSYVALKSNVCSVTDKHDNVHKLFVPNARQV